MRTTPPLLLICKGRKPRPRKATTIRPKESVLHCAVAKVLHEHSLPTWRWSHFPSGEKRDVIAGARLKRMGLQRGWPDFVMVSPDGRFYALELKRRGETLTDEQNDFRNWSIARRVPHVVAFAIDDVLTAFDQWGCLRIRIGGER
jgi:hypothetical protein